MIVLAWIAFALIQIANLVALVAGIFILPIPCLLHLWQPVTATVPAGTTRESDEWSIPINGVYGNPEEGPSGAHARLIGGAAYMPDGPLSQRFAVVRWLHASWRAYMWSGFRNFAGNLKYVFRWRGKSAPPFVHGTWAGGREWKVGWQPENGLSVPVISG